VNWLNTSQGYAAAYNLDAGATTVSLWSTDQAFPLGGGLYDLYRNANAHYFLPTEDEYYKAAYYDPNKPGGAGYWLYATGSDVAPTAVASGTDPGTAVYGNPQNSEPAAVDQAGGLSPYGTEGQTGNVFEWMESDYNGGYDPTQYPGAAVRGDSWMTPGVTPLESSSRYYSATGLVPTLGFRVVSVPEPSSMVLMIGPCLVLLSRRRRARFI
jgi:formylglycine-generating enzyme required for sulfatase activity